MIPRFVEDLDETNAFLDEPPREQARIGVATLARFGAIHLQHLLRLLAEVHHLRRDLLHPVGQLVAVDASRNLRIANDAEALLIQARDRLDGVLLQCIIHTGGIGKVKDRIALSAERYTAVDGWEESAAVIAGATAR